MQIINTYKELDLSKHIFINFATEINVIIAPLRQHFGLDCFNYFKTYHDGSQIRLSNTPEWLKHYLSQELYLHSIFESAPNKYNKSKLLWSNIKSHKKIIVDAASFGILNGITLIEPVVDGCEFYFLGTSQNSQMVVDSYVNKLNLLDKFVLYFREQAKHLLNDLFKQRVLSLDRMTNELTPTSIHNKKLDMHFLANLAGLNFTDKEMECITFLLSGYSAKIIGEQMKISNRTVEAHINNIKNKLDIRDKNQLICRLNAIF